LILLPRKIKKKTVLANVFELHVVPRESARNNRNKFEQLVNSNQKTTEVIKSVNHSPKYKLIQTSTNKLNHKGNANNARKGADIGGRSVYKSENISI